ncbi:MAG: glycosyltransferase family 2 protein [Betaproteobacteria bacterium]|nr:glycosyltransferase family 2 protein [Betaproteobacteria bacterium]
MQKPVFNPCILIPVYNHEHAIGQVLAKVLNYRVACLLVDDGSSAVCAQELNRLAASYPAEVVLLRHAWNQGKGAAVLTGMQHAVSHGYTHVLQIDADGQHDTNDIPVFLEYARKHPDAIVTGYPVYDESVPSIRFFGRYLTHVWVWINTLSLKVKDSMCGFRVYPILPVIRLITRQPLRKRMAFDSDIIVRLYWDGVDVVNLPTRISYPADGVSHFRLWSDNFQIACMHARLFLGMLIRLPQLLRHKRERR